MYLINFMGKSVIIKWEKVTGYFPKPFLLENN